MSNLFTLQSVPGTLEKENVRFSIFNGKDVVANVNPGPLAAVHGKLMAAAPRMKELLEQINKGAYDKAAIAALLIELNSVA